MEPKDQAIPITLCKSRITSLWIPLPSFSKSLIWVVGVEMSKKRLSTFYMLQNFEGNPLPGLPCYMFGGAARFFHHVLPKMAEAFAREITLTTLERLFSRVFEHVYIQRTSLSARMIALIAFEGLLSSVSALVFFHMRSSSA